MVQWGFNEKRKDEPLVGGAEQYAISRKVHNFVREAIQNCWDQRLSEFDPVKVTFTFVELEGDELDAFLGDVKWTEGLKEHIEACSTQNNHDKPKLKRNLEKFNNGKMRILQVSDSNTKGLSGPEFGDQGNFSKLCRNEMTPSEGGGSAARGGAFGGKSLSIVMDGRRLSTRAPGWGGVLEQTAKDMWENKKAGRPMVPLFDWLSGAKDGRQQQLQNDMLSKPNAFCPRS